MFLKPASFVGTIRVGRTLPAAGNFQRTPPTLTRLSLLRAKLCQPSANPSQGLLQICEPGCQGLFSHDPRVLKFDENCQHLPWPLGSVEATGLPRVLLLEVTELAFLPVRGAKVGSGIHKIHEDLQQELNHGCVLKQKKVRSQD